MELVFFVQDEIRFGLFTRNWKMLTAKSVKSICSLVQLFQSTYLFGAFSPITGDKFMLELPQYNTDTFQLFHDEFAKQKSDELKIILLDNGAFYKAER